MPAKHRTREDTHKKAAKFNITAGWESGKEVGKGFLRENGVGGGTSVAIKVRLSFGNWVRR